jgi:hypothetical protein
MVLKGMLHMKICCKTVVAGLLVFSGVNLPAEAAGQAVENGQGAGPSAGSGSARAFCRFVPERSDDFAWENDKVAFRAYGPALRDKPEDSGIDCWLKRVDYPIIDKWYGQMKTKSYHKDWGEGYDPYHVGSSRGCGGIALWMDEKLVTLDTFTEWKIIRCEPEEAVFVLTYESMVGGDVYKEEKKISIKPGERLFHAVSTFWKNGVPASGLPIAIGVTTHDGKAAVSDNVAEGWVACWETIQGSGLGTGMVMDPARIIAFRQVDTPVKDDGHALLIAQTDANGEVAYAAGYGWQKAGEIKTSEEWQAYLKQAASHR